MYTDIRNLSFLDPIPPHIKKHHNFALTTFRKLYEENQNDTFLQELIKRENLEILLSFNWYSKYDIEDKIKF